MCRCSLYQDLIGSALAAVPNDELDTAIGDSPKQTGKETMGMGASSSGGAGMGILTKLIFFGVIVGLVMVFLKSRKSPVEKSLA